MKNWTFYAKSAVTTLGAWIGVFLGSIDGLIITLLAFAAFDYLTGVACAITKHKLSSAVGFKGIARKVFMFVMVGIANLIDVYVIQQGCVLRTATIFFYLANEGVSILENGGKLGMPIPKKLKDVLYQLKKKDDEDDKKGN